ncbi:MAG: addiction module antidote protein, HigA family [Desulfovibrionales bacterium GWA2_65_9]|nr:MAG: addiction module antidote protein, HigA family [Desulfovibrionales bacterium GWA2_65_9]
MSEKILPPIHPGEILLEEFLQPMGISQSRLALAIRVPMQRVHDIVHGRRGISLDTAARLARFFGTSPDLWLNLQTHYDMEKARDEGLFVRVDEDVRPLERV